METKANGNSTASLENIDVEMEVAVLSKSDKTENGDDKNTTIESSTSSKAVKKRKKVKQGSPSHPHKKAKKDPNKPEYPKVGYVRFMNVRREELRNESPDMHHLDVTKKIGEEWMAMSAEKKKPFLDAAIEDKIRYKKEMKKYRIKLKNEESTSPAKGKKKPKHAINCSDTSNEPSPKKVKKKSNSLGNESKSNGIGGPKSPQKLNEKITQNGEKSKSASSKVADQRAISTSIASINTPPPTPPRIDTQIQPMYGDIPIFTDQFLEHNRQMESELKKLRKLNTDTELQNSVLEKHVENVRNGITKANAEIDDLKSDNEKLSAYLTALRLKLATQLRNLSIPSEPNGANINNIDKYMNDLFEMAKDNSHGPASLNKAKDLLRKVDLTIDLKASQKG